MSATDKPEQENEAARAHGAAATDHQPSRDEGDAADEALSRELRPEDQARVDGFLKRGVNSVERKPFRPVLLMIMLIVVVAGLSFLAQGIARMAGVY